MRFGASSTSATSNALPRYASFELCKKNFQPGQASQRPINMLSNDQLTMWLRKEVPSLAQISVATWNQGGVHATLRTLVVRFPDYNPPSSRNLRVGGIGLPQWHMPSLDFNGKMNSEKSLKTWTYVFRQTVI